MRKSIKKSVVFLDMVMPELNTKITTFLLFILSFLVFFYTEYKWNVELLGPSFKNYMKITISTIASELPSKWFTWIEFILVIGVLSILNLKFHDGYITVLITISYILIYYDINRFFYASFAKLFFNPRIEINNKLATIDKSFSKIFNSNDKLIQYAGAYFAFLMTYDLSALINNVLNIYIASQS